jgi:RNA polymerase sigma-70 factor (ECF subfamily)
VASKIRGTAEGDADWGLLARAAGGDGDAFTLLVERHQDRLVGLCARWLGEREEARDAAQEIFLKVFRHAAKAEPRGQFFTWLYRIAINHCLNRLRRRKIVRFLSLGGMGGDREASAGAPVAAFEPVDGAPDAETALLARERWRRTREVLDRLPENQRVVVLLARFEGLSGREIAETLGISEGAVESRLVRAMRRLAPQEAPAAGVPVKEGGSR